MSASDPLRKAIQAKLEKDQRSALALLGISPLADDAPDDAKPVEPAK